MNFGTMSIKLDLQHFTLDLDLILLTNGELPAWLLSTELSY